MFIA
ncbi:hypothetical protein MPL3365_170254 [Mesorhizobium plurifarium]